MKDFKEAKTEFEEIKNTVKEIDTSDKMSGIYIMYIEGLNFDNLIPIYIGQSVNLYNRRTSHKGRIKRLFVLNKEEYNEQIPKNAGKYLYCKIVSTLKNNKKSLEDVKFRVLEYCEKEKLDERELYWISFFESSVYGFNQFQEIIDSNKFIAKILYSKTKLDYNIIAKEGIELLKGFEVKMKDFNNELIDYKYYFTNYTLLLGNYTALYHHLFMIHKEHLKEIRTNLSDYLTYTKDIIKEYNSYFMEKNSLIDGFDFYDVFEIK